MIKRQAARALLLTPQQELLLIKITEPLSNRGFWLTPGGGIDPGESPVAGLRRELFEEIGLREFEVGPEVWQRQHTFTWDGQVILQQERFYLVRIDRFEPTGRYMPDPAEQAAFAGFRWWPVREIEQSSELFAPGSLGRLLYLLIETGPPDSPLLVTD